MGRFMNTNLTNTKFFALLLGLLVIFSSSIQAQKVNLDSLNRVMNENHLVGLELIRRGNKAEGLSKLYIAVGAFRNIDYELAEKRDSVKKVIAEWLKAKPESPFYNYLMGNIIYLTKRDSAGLADTKAFYNTSISLEPQFISPYTGLARVAELQNDKELAINCYKNVIQIDSTAYSVHLALAALLIKVDRKYEAERLYKRIVTESASPRNKIWASVALSGMAKTLDESNKICYDALLYSQNQQDSIIVYERIFDNYKKESVDSFLTFASSFFDSKAGKIRALRSKTMVAYFNELVKKYPEQAFSFADYVYKENNPYIMQIVGSYLGKTQNDYLGSVRMLEKAFSITNDESVYETILFGKKESNQLKQIAKEFSESTIATEVSFSLIGLKEYVKAESYLIKALPYAKQRGEPAAYFLLAKAKRENNNINDAIKFFVRGLAIKEVQEERKNLEEMIVKNNLQINADQLIKEAKMADQLVNEVRLKNSVTAGDFSLPETSGKLFKLSEQKGKVVLLDFWATWCSPCIVFIPQLLKLRAQYLDNPNVVFQSVNVDETTGIVKEFMLKKNYSFDVLYAVGTTVPKDYNVTAIPAVFLIDKNGKIQFKHIGFDSKENIVESLSREIDELLSTN